MILFPAKLQPEKRTRKKEDLRYPKTKVNLFLEVPYLLMRNAGKRANTYERHGTIDAGVRC